MKNKAKFAHYLNHIVKEFGYRLNDLLKACQRGPQSKPERPTWERFDINYGYSAFVSLIQGFKDILSVLSDEAMHWSSFASIKHMTFIKNSRNALTHDGHPIIDMWINGHYYMARDIIRFDQRGGEVLITAPVKDIATVCLEFSIEFLSTIKDLIKPLAAKPEIRSFLYSSDDFKEMFKHPAHREVPEEIIRKIDAMKNKRLPNQPNPIKETIERLDLLIDFSTKELSKINTH